MVVPVPVVLAMVPGMILMIPVAFMQLPALAVVVIVGMVPICAFIGRTVPAPCYPRITMPMRSPVPVDPGVARARNRPAPLVAQRRRCGTDVHPNLCRSRDGESHGEKYATYPIPFHCVSPAELLRLDH